MADLTNIDTGVIGSAVNQLDGIVASITGTTVKVKDAVAGLDKGWVSPVKAEFMSRFARDTEAMAEMLDQLREVSEQLKETARDFDATESDLLSRVSALR